MSWKVLVSAPYFLPVVEEWRPRLAPEGVELVAAQVNERLSEKELLEVVADIDGIICGDDRITKRVLDAAPRLKVISKWGTGIDSIDSKAAADASGSGRIHRHAALYRARTQGENGRNGIRHPCS